MPSQGVEGSRRSVRTAWPNPKSCNLLPQDVRTTRLVGNVRDVLQRTIRTNRTIRTSRTLLRGAPETSVSAGVKSRKTLMLPLQGDDGIEIVLRIFVSGIALHGTA